jgi:hypothetical protein
MADTKNIVRFRSNTTDHFTGTIAQYAAEAEDIATALGVSRMAVHSVSIQALQALDFELWFFSKVGKGNADLDLDTAIAKVDLDLSTNGQTYNVGTADQYYYHHRLSVPLVVTDDDPVTTTGWPRLHLALVNNSATGKLATGSGGDVIIVVEVEPLGG